MEAAYQNTPRMDGTKESHHKLTLRFPQTLSHAPSLFGTLAREGAGVEWTYVCSGEVTQLRRAAEVMGATVVNESAVPIHVRNMIGYRWRCSAGRYSRC